MGSTSLDKELKKANAREQVANRKLERLKERYDKLKLATDSQLAKYAEEQRKSRDFYAETLARNIELEASCKNLSDEAAMWKAQLFEQLDRLDEKKADLVAQQQDFYALQSELAEAQWQLVELVDLERNRAETELAKSHAQIDSLKKELVSANARIEGLRNLGTYLTAKLERATAQRKVLQREHARLCELAEDRKALLINSSDELRSLENELFEARGKLLSHHLDTSSWEGLRESLGQQGSHPFDEACKADKARKAIEPVLVAAIEPPAITAMLIEKPPKRKPLRLAPSQAQSDITKPPSLLRRAGKAIGSWLKLS